MSAITPKLGKRVRTGIVLAAIVAAGATTAAAVSGGGDSGAVTVTAMFTDVSPMVAGNVVKASGVKVGTISDIELVDGVAKVAMDVERSVLPLHSDASATIITQDLLGERFIELDRGSPDKPALQAGAVIEQERTRRVVDLDEVLNAVDNPTGAAFAALLSTLGEGAAGNGKEIAAAIKALAPAMRQSEELASILDEQNELLTTLIDHAQPVASAVAGERGTRLDSLVGSATKTLSTVAADREAVQSALKELPATLASARKTLADVAGVSDSTAGTLKELRPLTDDLSEVSRELYTYSTVADPALAALPPVLERGNKLLDEAAPLVKALRPMGPQIRSVASSTKTLAEQALSKRLGHFMEFVKGWSLATTDYDAISHYFKAIVPVSPKVSGQVGVGMVPGQQSPVPETDVLPPPPDLGLPGRDEDGDQPLLPPVENESDSPSDGSATGLSEQQENSMLGQLLGGR